MLYTGECNTHRVQKMATDPLELELQDVKSCWTWVLATEHKSYGEKDKTKQKKTSSLNLFIVSSAPGF